MPNESAFVELVDHMGDDLAVVNSARVSLGKSSYEIGERETGIINRTMRDRHGSVFEHSVMTFYVRCPIFVAGSGTVGESRTSTSSRARPKARSDRSLVRCASAYS